jgi:hypothetical protein
MRRDAIGSGKDSLKSWAPLPAVRATPQDATVAEAIAAAAELSESASLQRIFRCVHVASFLLRRGYSRRSVSRRACGFQPGLLTRSRS